MKTKEEIMTLINSNQTIGCENILGLGSGQTEKQNLEANELHERLEKMAAEESSTLVRDLRIRILEPIRTQTKNGRPMIMVPWEYQNIDYDDGEWRPRKSPLYSKESKLLIESGPYDADSIYRVTAEKDEREFFSWVAIEKIETADTPTEGAAQ